MPKLFVTVSCPLCGHSAPAGRKIRWMDCRTPERPWLHIQTSGGRGVIRTILKLGPNGLPVQEDHKALFNKILAKVIDLMAFLVSRKLLTRADAIRRRIERSFDYLCSHWNPAPAQDILSGRSASIPGEIALVSFGGLFDGKSTARGGGITEA